MAQSLDAVPSGSDLLIDVNVFVYGLTAKSAQCRALLERCSREDVAGITLYEVLHDATHLFMKGEAVEKGLCGEKALNYLKAHPEEVKRLTDYWANTQRLLALNLLFLPTEQDIVVGAQAERVSAGLLTGDSIIVAAMREYGISSIATHDQHFDAVAGLSVFSPTDVV